MGKLGVLARSMDGAYERLRDRLDGIGEDEFFWLPVANAWTIHEARPGRWTYDYAIPDPTPAPLTTIAWQVVHLGTTRLMYHDWAYGEARLTFPDIDIPHDIPGTFDLLQRGFDLLREDLENESDETLDQPRKTNWGEEWPAWRIFAEMTDHDALHTGAIGVLRDLYYWTTHS